MLRVGIGDTAVPVARPIFGRSRPKSTAVLKQTSSGSPTDAAVIRCIAKSGSMREGLNMAGKSLLAASEEQRAGLRSLAKSRDRGEADRARSVLLTLAGFDKSRIAEAFGIHQGTRRLSRGLAARGGVEGLKANVAPGPGPGEE